MDWSTSHGTWPAGWGIALDYPSYTKNLIKIEIFAKTRAQKSHSQVFSIVGDVYSICE
jgi:hypothetical protein